VNPEKHCIIIFINTIYCHENAIRKGQHVPCCAEAVLDGFQWSKRRLIIWQFFFSIGRMPFMAPTLNDADTLFAVVKHQVSICTT